MNDNERNLLRTVAEGDIRKAQDAARVILNGITAQKDQIFKTNLLRMLDARPANFIELPHNLRDLLIAEDVSAYPTGKLLMRDAELSAAERILSVYRVSLRLQVLSIHYPAAALFHGPSGTGKTELARYVAHKANLPFVYVRFSSLLNSLLGGTQSNLSKVFAFARTSPCVLCFDEIDAIGMKRGDSQDVTEMARVTIALMSELDLLPNNVIIIGTTNRFDRLDPALARRFPIKHMIASFAYSEAQALAEKFFRYVEMYPENNLDFSSWCEENLEDDMPVAAIVNVCTEKLVSDLCKEV